MTAQVSGLVYIALDILGSIPWPLDYDMQLEERESLGHIGAIYEDHSRLTRDFIVAVFGIEQLT